MFGEVYNARKNALLDIYEQFRHVVDNQGGLAPEVLAQRVQSLRDGHFVLAVVGEVKTGKSTLINAILGEMVLPTDALQATSAVVEIYPADRKVVEVTFADGTMRVIEDDAATEDVDETHEALRKVASVPGRYRKVPFPMLNAFLVQHEGRYTDEEAEALLATLPNPFNVEPAELRALTLQYLGEYRGLDHIARKIRFGYPFRYRMNQIRIVDTPGVNAMGCVEDITYQYINEAQAILFTQPIHVGVENKNLREFVKQTVLERSKSNLFLVFTMTGMASPVEIQGKMSEAASIYRDLFDPAHILWTDSLLRLIADELEAYDSPKALLAEYKAQTDRLQPAASAGDEESAARAEYLLYHSKRKLLKHVLDDDDLDNEGLRKRLMAQANFEPAMASIERFASVAPLLQLQEIADSIRTALTNRLHEQRRHIHYLDTKRRSPQQLAKEIQELADRLEQYLLKLNNAAENLKARYSGNDSAHVDARKAIKETASAALATARTEEAVRKAAGEAGESLQALVDGVAGEVRADLTATMDTLGDEFAAGEDVPAPPRVDLASIEEQAKKTAYRTETIYRDEEYTRYERRFYTLWLWEHPVRDTRRVAAGERQVFDSAKYVKNLRDSVSASLISLVDKDVPERINEVVKTYGDLFVTQMRAQIDAINMRMAELRDAKMEAEEILADIARLEEDNRVLAEAAERLGHAVEDFDAVTRPVPREEVLHDLEVYGRSAATLA